MPSNAVNLALASESTPAVGSADPAAEARRPRRARPLRPSRPHLIAFGLAALAIWLVFVFGRALTELNDATERAAALSSETAALQARLEAGQRELELVQSDAFHSLQARAYGLGGPNERAFALEADAPPAPAIVPLGGESPGAERTPLESWLRLLFGSP